MNAANQMEKDLETLKKANLPMEQRLKGIEEVLKKRLPLESV